MYVTIERNPKLGHEIQDESYESYVTLISIFLERTYVEEDTNRIHDGYDGVLYGTKILLNTVSPWTFSNKFVYDHSYFASVVAAEALKDTGLCFIGVVKNGTKKYNTITF